MGLFSCFARANDDGFQANQWTGLSACCNRYGLLSLPSKFLLFVISDIYVLLEQVAWLVDALFVQVNHNADLKWLTRIQKADYLVIADNYF